MHWSLLPMALLAASPAMAESGVQIVGHWIAGCDNENVCTAIRPAWDAVDVLPNIPGTPFLKMRHHPHRDATPEFWLVDPENPAPLAVLKPPLVSMVFHFNDSNGVGNALAYRAVIDGEGGYRFLEKDARSILYGLRKAKYAVVTIADRPSFILQPGAFDEILAFFDRSQELEDTPGALVLRPDGVMYDYNHPRPPEADTVQLSPFTKEQFDKWLAAYLKNHPGQKVKHEQEARRGLITAIRYNSFDFDCGIFERWGHIGTTNDFVLVERREMPVCAGLPVRYWIRTYRAEAISPDK
ncbi:MAG: hypothetical protein ACK4SJ_06510 [Sphingorhabdus sp.]